MGLGLVGIGVTNNNIFLMDLHVCTTIVLAHKCYIGWWRSECSS